MGAEPKCRLEALLDRVVTNPREAKKIRRAAIGRARAIKAQLDGNVVREWFWKNKSPSIWFSTQQHKGHRELGEVELTNEALRKWGALPPKEALDTDTIFLIVHQRDAELQQADADFIKNDPRDGPIIYFYNPSFPLRNRDLRKLLKERGGIFYSIVGEFRAHADRPPVLPVKAAHLVVSGGHCGACQATAIGDAIYTVFTESNRPRLSIEVTSNSFDEYQVLSSQPLSKEQKSMLTTIYIDRSELPLKPVDTDGYVFEGVVNGKNRTVVIQFPN